MLNNPAVLDSLVSDEVSEVTEWAEKRIESGEYPDTTGRFRIRALEALVEFMPAEEPKTAQYVLENIDSLTDRWATKKKMSGDTPSTYKSRARGLLEDYLKWKANPSGFKVDRKETAAKKKEKTAKKAAETDVTPAPAGGEIMETIRLEGGKVFRFTVGEITMKDAARIAYALAARATDFDPKDFVFGRGGQSGGSSSTELATR